MVYSEQVGASCHVRAYRRDLVKEEKFQGILGATRLALYFDQRIVLVNPEIKD